MAEEWAPMGVRVNAVAPGPFRTDMLEDLERAAPGFMEESADVTMVKRVAEPEEIVGPVVFLASEAASYVTAQTLSVCGGAI
jgi:NAD(P)-dependent dehydrogenase (short-subunit alcohol dehydrogenase family)